ncbi:hypothetical protein ABW20_dc0108928 [Dactylellina cionopaga]|nr:hypothetical protein ABW20_dc0108928 [Dactylellina cionopaga]
MSSNLRKRRRQSSQQDEGPTPSRRPRLSDDAGDNEEEDIYAIPPSQTISSASRSSGGNTQISQTEGDPPPPTGSDEDPHFGKFKALFDVLVRNVFLPPKLPDKALDKVLEKESDHYLLQLLSQAAQDFGHCLVEQDLLWWKKVQKNIATLVNLYELDPENSWLSTEKLAEVLLHMEEGDFLTLNVRRQNAGLIIRKEQREAIFEAFEASSLADVVAECRKRLICSFPGPRTGISIEMFQDNRHTEALAQFIAQLDGSSPDIADGKSGSVNDAGAALPSYITHLLTGIMRGLGHAKEERETKICKRVADAVLGTENSVWRRSPMWLVVRVGLQTTLKLQKSHHYDWYKVFLVYFMSKALGRGLSEKLIDPDYLYIMGAKIARRVQKLNDNIPESVRADIVSTLEKLSKVSKTRWEIFCGIDAKKIDWNPADLNFNDDCNLTLKNSITHISTVLNQGTSLTAAELSQHPFTPGAFSRIKNPMLFEFDLAKTSKKDLTVLLMDIEAWVESELDEYVTLHRIDKDAVVKLADLFNRYFGIALREYEGNPENISVAFLTGFEIWVAMDKITTACTPTLAKYHPEIKGSDLNNLLVPSRRQMQRLAKIQNHVMDREKRAEARHGTIFQDKASEGTFQVAYYDENPYYEELREKVEVAALVARNAMIKSLKEVNKKYRELRREADAMEHDFTPTGKHRTARLCAKCKLETEARQLTIGKHEWPLPADDEDLPLLKTLIFELDCPKHFQAWRDITFKMLVNTSAILRFTETDPETQSKDQLATYFGLRNFYKDERNAGIIYASQTKAIGREGGLRIELPADEEEILVGFSLKPRYWYNDSSGGHWVRDFFKLKGLWDKRMFAYKLPNDSLYKPLQFAVWRTDHTSNKILSIQNKCPPKLSLHEFYEYGTLRAGHSIQWIQIAKGLRARILSLNKQEVSYLILQAAWEAGPAVRNMRNLYLRDTHRFFDTTSNIVELLNVIEGVSKTVQTNWLEIVNIATLVALTCRCLALIRKDQQAVLTQAINLLLQLRGIVYGWIEDLRKKVQLEQEENSLTNKLQYMMHCAAICRMTYEVPDEHADYLLDGNIPGQELEGTRDPKHIAIYLETGAIIRDNLPARREHVEEYFRHAIYRSTRLAHRWETRVRNLILENPESIDLAVEKQWQKHSRQSEWKAAPAPNQHWLRMTTIPALGDKAVQISLNLLDGQILMDSIPFGRLPHEYTEHPSYDRIFGGGVLAVGPSSMGGMQFETRFPIEGHQVHFALKNDELVIRSRKDDNIYELIPHTTFGGDICQPLIENFTHWMDLDRVQVQFRKLEDRWNTESYEWVLSFSSESTNIVRLDDPTVHAIDPNSPTSTQVNRILQSLEDKSYILITARKNPDPVSTTVHADLGRLNLKFSSKDKDFVCRNFPGFVVDQDQDLGCFHGLVNKLVLRKGSERMALVPFGEINLKRIDDFTKTTVIKARSYQAYTVDKLLGRLVGNGSVSSRLYQIYLHAVTSSPSCQRDTLTGRTGTEEAASLLGSGAVKSFQELDNVDIQLLHQIAQLTPQRTFGVSQKKDAPKRGRIESVGWNEALSFNCQRDIFRVGAKQVVDYWMKIKKFMPGTQSIMEDAKENDDKDEEDVIIGEGIKDKNIEEGVKRGDEILLRRAACRNEIFYAFLDDTWSESEEMINTTKTARPRDGDEPDDYLDDEEPNPIQDGSYTARDGTIQIDDDKEPAVCQLAKALIHWKTGMAAPNIWAILAGFTVSGIKASSKMAKLEVNDWLLKRSAGEIWCPLFEVCRHANKHADRFRLIFTLCTLTYRDGFDPKLVHALAAAAIIETFKEDRFKIPGTHIDLRSGYQPENTIVEKHMRASLLPFEHTNFAALPRRGNEDDSVAHSRRQVQYAQANGRQRSSLLQYYTVDQWPTTRPTPPDDPNDPDEYSLIDLEEANGRMKAYFKAIYPAYMLRCAIYEIQTVLVENTRERFKQQVYTFETYREVTDRPEGPATIEDLMDLIPAPLLVNSNTDPQPLTKASLSQVVEVVRPTLRHNQLQSLFRNLSGPRNSQFQKGYAEDLKNSIEALKRFEGNSGSRELPLSLDIVQEHALKWKEHVESLEVALRSHLEPMHFVGNLKVAGGQDLTYQAGLWPRVTIFALLKLLSYHASEIPSAWKRAIVTFGIAIRELGRAQRLLEYAQRGEAQGFWEALADHTESKWDAVDSPDWLLLEIENNFCMRDVQAEIAMEMINPNSGKSSVMQMNMGEGKSSVIIPAVSSKLADGKKLVRVVVLKPLSREMFNLLRSKLGGLCSRRIFFLPFHRSLNIDVQDVRVIKSIYQECMDDGGILLVQNEHLLSFKLLGLERICTWLDANSRDLLDESDEILRVNHTLVYTVGTQQAMSNQPYRWLDLLKVFDVIKAKVIEFQTQFPQGFEVVPKNEGSFPYLRILQLKAANALMKATSQALVYGDTPGHQWFATVSPEKLEIILAFITKKDFPLEDMPAVREVLNCGSMWDAALLFRGLFAYEILRFCLQEKRWRVDYGADLDRTFLAVPFKAKDTPSAASDFAHPEVLLCLTCLSWYNHGLDHDDILYCLEEIEGAENPEDEYRKWVQGYDDAPEHLKSLKSVNIYNVDEFKSIMYPMLQYSKAAIDFFLEHAVFPIWAKQFPYKLNSSGWDVVEKKPHITSGFSGTNDNKYLLPLSIEQHDLESHQHTNALVLNYLLATENNHFVRAAKPRTKEKMTVEELLDTTVAQTPPISVLLDVGAQVLELENKDVAREWLSRAAKVDPDRWQAAIYFNTKDEICVVDLVGRVELLMTSNFAKQMENCLCYLDDAHTRGTDLKFPLGSRALITLGPKTTKDRLIQGAMRMRKLGKGHSIVFCAPPDIESQILSISNGKTKVENVEVLKWALRETCKQTKKNAELWVAQGINYTLRSTAQEYYRKSKDWRMLRRHLFEAEQQSLQQLYDVKATRRDSYIARVSRQENSSNPLIREIVNRCQMFNIDNIEELSGELDEEQEREIEQEVEVEREIQRPPPAKPLPHILHKDLVKFVTKGTLPKKSNAVVPAIRSLRQTSIRPLIRPGSWSEKLLVSQDFAQTVELFTHIEGGRQIDYQDDFVRPVTFILSSAKTAKRKVFLVIISPFEADQLMDKIKSSKHVNLHIYVPKTSKSMPSFEGLKWMNIGKTYLRSWRIPVVLMDQLNLFAGQLYFRQRTSYLRTAKWMSLRTSECAPNIRSEADGFIPPDQRLLRMGGKFTSTFKVSPVPCMQQLLSMRRKGSRYDPTHLGQLLHGKLLPDDEFDKTDSDIEAIFDEDDSVSADESGDADYIKDEVEPLERSLAARRMQTQAQYQMQMNIDEEEGQGIEGDADNEEDYGDGELGGFSDIKQEDGYSDDDDYVNVDRSTFYRDSSPMAPDQDEGYETITLRALPQNEFMETEW